MQSSASRIDGTFLRTILQSQFHASLAMMRMAIERCPDELWASGDFVNPTWRIIYHALYYTHLYLQPSVQAFTPWEHHKTSIHDLDDDPAPPEIAQWMELPHHPPQTGTPYTKAQLLDYWKMCDDMVDPVIDSLDLAAEKSGFPWYGTSLLEHKFVALRHLQHHTAQIGTRIREASAGRNGIDWVGTGKRAKRAEFPKQ